MVRQQPTGLTGRVDGSDRSKWNLGTTRDFNRFRSCNRISCRISPPNPINIKCHGRLGNPIDQTNTTFIFLLSFCPSFFPSTIYCSYFVSTSIEGVLGGLPTLEQPCVRLPRRVLPGRRSLVSPPACPATTGLTDIHDQSEHRRCIMPSLTACSSVFVCWP